MSSRGPIHKRFSLMIKIQWKILSTVTLFLAMISLHNFAHACHVQNFIAISLIEFTWGWNQIKFESWWKKTLVKWSPDLIKEPDPFFMLAMILWVIHRGTEVLKHDHRGQMWFNPAEEEDKTQTVRLFISCFVSWSGCPLSPLKKWLQSLYTISTRNGMLSFLHHKGLHDSVLSHSL